jgi:hypothetical protein
MPQRAYENHEIITTPHAVSQQQLPSFLPSFKRASRMICYLLFFSTAVNQEQQDQKPKMPYESIVEYGPIEEKYLLNSVIIYVSEKNKASTYLDHDIYHIDGKSIVSFKESNFYDEYIRGTLNKLWSNTLEELDHQTHVTSVIIDTYIRLFRRKVPGINLIIISSYIGDLSWAIDDCNRRKEIDPYTNCVINISWGTLKKDIIDVGLDLEVIRSVYRDFFSRASQFGIPVIIGAGNDNIDACLTWPQAAILDYRESGNTAPLAVVGGLDENGENAYFSNTGQCVNVYRRATSIIGLQRNNQPVLGQGTSLAAPQFSAEIAYTFKKYGPKRGETDVKEKQAKLLQHMNNVFGLKYPPARNSLKPKF